MPQQGGSLVVQAGTLQGGTAMGGASGAVAAAAAPAPAKEFGAGIFLQGDETITLAPGAGQTLDVHDRIADERGSVGTSDLNKGALLIGPGTVELMAANTYTGGTTIKAGGVLELGGASSAGKGPIKLPGTSDTLLIDAGSGGVIIGNTIEGLRGGDAFDLLGFLEQSGTVAATVTFDGTTDQLFAFRHNGSIVPVETVLQFDTGRGYQANAFHASLDAAGTGTLITYTACYAEGTRIATEFGEIPVERLGVGQRVRLAGHGGAAPVVWLGHREIDCARHPRPHQVWPVRILRNAFGPGLPLRTLWLSPDHAVLVDGDLIPIRYLVNGASIAIEPRQHVSYLACRAADARGDPGRGLAGGKLSRHRQPRRVRAVSGFRADTPIPFS